MTNRNDWHAGASTCILCGWENHTDKGFELYETAGVKYAEFSVAVWDGSFEKLDFYDHPEKIYETAKRRGVEFTSIHLPVSRTVSFSNPDAEVRREAVKIIKKAVTAAAKIGIKTMVMHPSSAFYDEYPDREILMKQCIGHIGEIYEHCEKLGVTLAIENMTGVGLCGTPAEMIRLLNTYKNLKICFDTNHCALIHPEDYLDALLNANMQGRVATLHVSDYDLEEEKHRLPGDGKINWEAILTKLEALDYNGVFMYEVSRPGDREEICTPQTVADNFNKIILRNK